MKLEEFKILFVDFSLEIEKDKSRIPNVKAEIDLIIPQLNIEFNKSTELERGKFSIDMVDLNDEVILNHIINLIDMKKYLIEVYNNESIQYDGKDVGYYVKHKDTNKFFKVYKRKYNDIYDKNDTLYRDDECIPMSLKEVRNYKMSLLK